MPIFQLQITVYVCVIIYNYICVSLCVLYRSNLHFVLGFLFSMWYKLILFQGIRDYWFKYQPHYFPVNIYALFLYTDEL